jgi:hypothetical protein
MAEELVAEVGEDALTRPAGEVGLRRRGGEVREAGDDEEGDDDGERLEILLADAVVERELGQVGRDERGERGSEEGEDRHGRAQLVRRSQPSERRDPARRALPGPVLDPDVAPGREVRPGLPDLHLARLPLRSPSRCSRAGVLGDPTSPTHRASLAATSARMGDRCVPRPCC